MNPPLRVCAHCEWIFEGTTECPKCQFGSYTAHAVYGDACYRFAKSQKPWKDRQLAIRSAELDREIKESQPPRHFSSFRHGKDLFNGS